MEFKGREKQGKRRKVRKKRSGKEEKEVRTGRGK